MANVTKQEIFKHGSIENYLNAQQNKTLLRFITCGSVDDGKSTLIGRLLHDSDQIYDDQLSTLYLDSKKIGVHQNKLDLALLIDGLQSERTQGITIDVAYRYFSTQKRKFIIADTPGHEEYTRNMVTGASTSELAILLIDARKGMRNQTRRHWFINKLLGIRYIIIAINKMDLVDYNQKRFQEIIQEYSNFFKSFSVNLNIKFIPISALDGDNIIAPSINMPWYDGPTLINILENANIDYIDIASQKLRFPIQYVIRDHSGFRGYCGLVASGSISVGQRIKIFPSNTISTIKRIFIFNKDLDSACPGESITVTLEHDVDITRGDLLINIHEIVCPVNSAWVDIVWMNNQQLKEGQYFNIKIAHRIIRAQVEIIQYQINMDTLIKQNVREISMNGVGLIKLLFNESLILDQYSDYPVTGSMIFIDILTNETVGAGMVHMPIQDNDNSSILKTDNAFEIELHALIQRYFPHWNACNVR